MLLKINHEGGVATVDELTQRCSQWCVQWFPDRRECVCVCVVSVVFFRASSVLFCHPHTFYSKENSVDGHTPVWPVAFTLFHFSACRRLTHTRVTALWLQCFWWTAPLPRHMTEHCSAAAAPAAPPPRLRDSMSKLKPGGWRGGRRDGRMLSCLWYGWVKGHQHLWAYSAIMRIKISFAPIWWSTFVCQVFIINIISYLVIHLYILNYYDIFFCSLSHLMHHISLTE